MRDPDEMMREKMREARQMDYLEKTLDPKATLLEKNMAALRGMAPDTPQVSDAPSEFSVGQTVASVLGKDPKTDLMEKATAKALSRISGRAITTGAVGGPLTLAMETYNALQEMGKTQDPEYIARYMGDQYGPMKELPPLLRRELDDAAMERLRRDGYVIDRPHDPDLLAKLDPSFMDSMRTTAAGMGGGRSPSVNLQGIENF